jgi:hypothetical protein
MGMPIATPPMAGGVYAIGDSGDVRGPEKDSCELMRERERRITRLWGERKLNLSKS